MSYSQKVKKVFFKSVFIYLFFIIVLLVLYTNFIKERINTNNEEFLIFNFYSDSIKNFEIEVYNVKNELKYKKELVINEKKTPIFFKISENISNSDIIHLTFNKKGLIKYNNIKIKQNKNLLSIGISDFEEYFLLNKNIHIEDNNIEVNLKYPGKARIIMKALTNKMINLK